MSGRATASIVEFSGSSVALSATAARTARGEASDDADDARIAVDLDRVAVRDRGRCNLRADDGRDPVLARDDGIVAQHPTSVRDPAQGERHVDLATATGDADGHAALVGDRPAGDVER